MSTTVRCAGLELTIGPAVPADAVHVIRTIASGRFVTGTANDLKRAAGLVRSRRGTVLLVRGPELGRPWAVVGGIASGRLIPTVNLTIGLDPRAGSFIASVVTKAVTGYVLESLKKGTGRAALTCDTDPAHPDIEEILTNTGWFPTQTVAGGLRRHVCV